MPRHRGGELLQETGQRSNKQVHCLFRHRYLILTILLLLLCVINPCWGDSNCDAAHFSVSCLRTESCGLVELALALNSFACSTASSIRKDWVSCLLMQALFRLVDPYVYEKNNFEKNTLHTLKFYFPFLFLQWVRKTRAGCSTWKKLCADFAGYVEKITLRADKVDESDLSKWVSGSVLESSTHFREHDLEFF